MPQRLPVNLNLLDLRPARRAEWQETREDRVVLHRPRPPGRGLAAWLARLTSWLAPPRLRLDRIASHAWRQLDGTRTAAEVAASLRQRFGDAAEPAEERLGTLLRLLRRDGFLALPPWDDAADARADSPAQRN